MSRNVALSAQSSAQSSSLVSSLLDRFCSSLVASSSSSKATILKRAELGYKNGFADNFSLTELLGKGSFGQVRSYKHPKSACVPELAYEAIP